MNAEHQGFKKFTRRGLKLSINDSLQIDVKLELGDFLHRIPPHLLVDGPHDLMAELRFEIQDLSDRINNGQTTVSLSEIYKRLPDIFRGKILDSDNIEVRFPWQKLAKLVNLSGPGKSNALQPDAAAEALAEKLRAKRHAPPAAQEPHRSLPPVLPGRGPRRPGSSSRTLRLRACCTGESCGPSLPLRRSRVSTRLRLAPSKAALPSYVTAVLLASFAKKSMAQSWR